MQVAGQSLVPSSFQPVKLYMLILLAWFVFSYGVGSIHCSTVPGNSTDVAALLDFKNAITIDPQGVLSTYWNASTPYCQWKGVKCSLRHPGRVTALELSAQGLSGPIAASVGNLTFLRTLDLSRNNFSGQIPHLNNLQKIQIINLNYNPLGGIIPETLTNCSSLKELSLYGNLLEASIPPQIGVLSNLVYLDISQNNLTGIIPSTLGNITYLREIYLGQNKLEGSIPDELGQLSNISILFLRENSLSGSIPVSLFNSSSLQQLELSVNPLDDTLPTNIGDHLPNLQKLYLSNNMLGGQIPASLGNITNLDTINFQKNSFTGEIPSSFGKLSSLVRLDLQGNMLEAKDSESWAFLQALGNCSLLELLLLTANQLQGVIPNSIGNLPTSLEALALGSNKLSGMVPPSIGNLSGLFYMTLEQNSLTGTINEWIGNMKSLQALHLTYNNFTGSIPPSIGDLTKLTKLYLQENRFQGPIPRSFGNLQALLELDLSDNNFEGNIPPEVGNLKQLIQLQVSSNKLTGEIPNTLDQCQGLIKLEMDQNFLTGTIPVSFGNLKALSVLNLSHNNISGTIPTALGDLQLLTELDLSYNHLQGNVPTHGVFSNATAVLLDGNWGLCGATDLHMPLCPTAPKKTRVLYYLVRVLIPIFGFMSLFMLVYFLLVEKRATKRKYSGSTSSGEDFLKVSYNDLAQATKNFSEANLVGKGSYGSVYRGTLKEQKVEVAVKVFDLEMRGAERSFITECEALRSIQHRNLLSIITACSTVDNDGNVFKALLYEFMPNGSLDRWLHHKGDGKDPQRLGLTQIIGIAVNIADALDYLHHDCGRPTVHCDLKPCNILLDDDMNALLGDFGIARLYVQSRLSSTGSTSSIGVKGTIGYIAPEYAQGGHVSTSGDVYSFGIVLLEMTTGKRPTNPMFKDGLDIVNFVEGNFPHQIYHAIDVRLKDDKDFAQAKMVPENVVHQCLVSLLQIALSCAHRLPIERPSMKEVASKMHAVNASYLGGK